MKLRYCFLKFKYYFHKIKIRQKPFVSLSSLNTDESPNWTTRKNETATKLIKGSVILSKLPHFVNKDICSHCVMVFFTHILLISA